MTIAYWCVLAALVLPYLFIGVAKFTGRDFGPKENHNPREFLEKLEGARKRAYWAQQNSFEVTPAFAVAVIIAHQVGEASQGTLDMLALTFVISRVLYGVFYIRDLANLRSLVWAVGMVCIVAFFALSA